MSTDRDSNKSGARRGPIDPLGRRRGSAAAQKEVSPEAARAAGADSVRRLILAAVEDDPEVRDAVRLLVAADVRVAVDEAEVRLGDRIQGILTSIPGQIGSVVAGFTGAINKAAEGAENVSHPRAFKFALVAILALFVGVVYLLVQNVRDVTVRNDFRVEMNGLVDQAALSVAATGELRTDIDANQSALTFLQTEQERDTAFRNTYEAFDFPSRIDGFNEEIGGIRMEMAELRREMDEGFEGMRRGQDRIRHRVAPIEAVSLTNRTRFYRSDLDRMAGETCGNEESLRVRRSFANWHVRSCTDGYNGTKYRLWCGQYHKGQSPGMSYSSCTSTSPHSSS